MTTVFICAGCSMHIPDSEDATHWCAGRIAVARRTHADRVVVEAMRNYHGENRPTQLSDACRALEEFKMLVKAGGV